MLDNKRNPVSVIFHVMKEEHDRLSEAEQAYQKNISQLPRGSLRLKHIRNHNYLYLVHRDGHKVVYKYVGTPDSDKAKQITGQIEKRKRFVRLLQDIRHDLKDVKKVLRGKI
jgi:hypothetical protein